MITIIKFRGILYELKKTGNFCIYNFYVNSYVLFNRARRYNLY